jgi:hypothetical protein
MSPALRIVPPEFIAPLFARARSRNLATHHLSGGGSPLAALPP